MKQVFIPFTNQQTMTCCSCGETKPHTDFRKRKGGVVSTSCKLCVNKVYKSDPKVAHMNAVKHRAKKAGLPFNLTKDDFVIPDTCPVLGITLNKFWGESDVGGDKDNSPSVDRVIPSLGYVKHNVRIISSRANRIKTDAEYKEIALVYRYVKRESQAVLQHIASAVSDNLLIP